MAPELEPTHVVDTAALDELNSAETRTLFDMADKLSSLGVRRLVNLPQIIVVGDQSSGKSSVLEAISHVHFPTHGGVCTRFATELVLRQGRRRRIEAAVRFADSDKPAHTLQVDDFDQEDIDRIITAAKEQMGLSDGPDYSRDVLRLEIEGPDMYPLTLVDLPGIYHTPTDKQSSAGIPIVRELVSSYMQKSNSIILAIISANNNLANQVVMKEAAKHDPNKERTLGVITKPDLLAADSSEEAEYHRLIRGSNSAQKLELGWHAIRNRAEYEIKLGPRDTVEEEFFGSGVWASIPPANRGIGALRVKLSKILHGHIKKCLPAVLEDIQLQLTEREDELSRLGQSRSSPEDMRAYLVDTAVQFQRLVGDGLRGHYSDPFFGGFDGTDRKIRARLRIFNRAIRHILLDHGSAYHVVKEEGDIPEQREVPGHLQDFLDDGAYFGLPEPQTITRAELATQLERQAAANQGTELPGYANIALVTQLFQKQAAPWEGIAEQHIESVVATVKDFVEDVVHDIIGPSNTTSTAAILATYVYPFFDAREQALAAKLQEILEPFKDAYAQPLDADFHEAMEKTVTERTTVTYESNDDGDPFFPHGRPVVVPQSGNEFGTERIIDTMQTFYSMSLRTFTDNLINLGIERCLVRQLPGILTPRLVTAMSDASLSELAAETEDVRIRRAQLQTDIELLKKGLEQCRRYRPRMASARPSAQPPSPTPQPETPSGSKRNGTSAQPGPAHTSEKGPSVLTTGYESSQAASAPKPAFGMSATGSGFGTSATGSGFGTSTAGSGFGKSSFGSTFGKAAPATTTSPWSLPTPAPTSVGTFGSNSTAVSVGPFGGVSAQANDKPRPSPFGSAPTTGQQKSPFGTAPTSQTPGSTLVDRTVAGSSDGKAGPEPPSTKWDWAPFEEPGDPGEGRRRYDHISVSERFREWSSDELRLADSRAMQKSA